MAAPFTTRQPTADGRALEALQVYAEGPCEGTIVHYASVA
ncbi:hypothetical protein SGL43_05407 [Streptomyces globisporus]|uniref:GNAT family N-acetyltransferase n=1 Tax=Streptomyces globisporus TaxID=1908 RepID=A0ABN8V7V7_STRGL|nr:hypothetical protein SGL43_05407 [Streptomyces globisporus]